VPRRSKRAGSALLHQRSGLAQLVNPLEFGQLHRAVDAGHLGGIRDLVRHHGHAVGDGKLHDIGQVVLVLRVPVVQPRQPAAQQAGRHGHDAAVDFPDLALGRARVLVFDDGPHLRRSLGAGAHDAPIAGRVGHAQREQGQALAVALRQQGLQRGRLGQRHIARQHQRDAVVGQQRQRLLHRVAGAELGLLARKLQPQRRIRAGARWPHTLAGGLDLCRAVPRDHHRLAGRYPRCTVNHMGQQGAAAQSV
jgi:hypothetical protein